MALANPRRRLRRLHATENAWRRLVEAGRGERIAPEILRPRELDRLMPEDAVHQGLLLEADPLPALDLAEVPDDGVVLALDQVTDPHNVGAILRSAAAFAVSALVMTNRHSPEATGVLAKAASGALEHVPLCLVQNLARALAELGARGFLRVGLDSEAADTIEAAPLRRPLVLVLGAEGRGLRQLTRETCDVTVRLDLPGAIGSLNVSNAAALALYAARRSLER
jgi:23S rRNA (guanosine2251-2'-O)-methyltransferase